MPQNNPIITIITVVYNSATTLRATIESVVSQLSDHVEYIIIDGGSTDGTQDIIKAYEGALAYWLSEPDHGIYDAWNKGLSCAAGKYIGFIGGDDLLLPGSLSAYITNIGKYPEIEYWSSKVALGHLEGRIIGKPWSWSSFRRYMAVAHVGSLHRRDLYDRLGIYDVTYRIAGDYEFLLRAGSSLKAGFIDKVTVIMGDGGVSNRFVKQTLIETSRAKFERGVGSIMSIRLQFYFAFAKSKARWLLSSFI
jgi:glycosyltransferase involved in cell wall biosynthesis